MANPRNSTRARRICFNTHRTTHTLTGATVMICHVCRNYISPATDPWRADHIKRHAEGGEDTPENLWPICLDCDAGVGGKAARDASEVAKGKRTLDAVYRLKEPTGPALPGTKRSGMKRTIDGRVIDRRTGQEIGGRKS
jgi:hypothetical protein